MPDRFGKIPIQHDTPTAPVVKETLQTLHNDPPPVKPKEKKGKAPKRKMAAYLWLVVLVGIFGLYTVLGFFAVPYYLTNTLPEDFNKKTGMTFDPGLIAFNPFTFEFSTKNARILGSSDSPPLATLQSLSADLAPFSLLRMDLVCNTVLFSELNLNITRAADGTYNFDKLIDSRKEGGPSEILNFSDLPFFFSLNNIAIKSSKILFVDGPTGKTHTIENIQLELPTFSNIPFEANQYLRPSFSAVINGSPFELTGQAHMGDASSETTTLTCNLHDLDLPIYAEYLPLDLPLLFTSGKVDGKIILLFDPQSQQDDKLSINFELELTDTELKAGDETVVVKAPATQVNGKVRPVAKTVVFSKVSISEPVLNSIGDAFLPSISSLIKKEKKAPVANAPVATPFALTIDELLVKDGAFHRWSSKEAKKPATTWNALQLSITGYSSGKPPTEKEKEPGLFVLSATEEGKGASFTWQGDLSADANLTGTLTLDKMDFKELLLIIGADKDLAVKGTTDLRGMLTLSLTDDLAAPISYKLTDGEMAIEDFQLLENKMAVVTGPVLKISALGTAYKTIHFGKVSLEKGSIHLPVGRLPKVFKQFTSGKYLVQGIDFKGQVTLIFDEKGKQKTTYPDLSFSIKDLDTPEKAKENISLSAKTSTGGTVQAHGDMRLTPFSLAINTEFSGLEAAEIFPVLSDSPLLLSVTGMATGKGVLSFPRKSYTGELHLAKGSVGKKASDSLVSWNDLIMRGIEFTSEPYLLGIAAATLDQPQFSWKITREHEGPMQHLTSFFQQHIPLSEGQGAAGPQTTTTAATSSVDIQEIFVKNGTILIEDSRLKPKWKADVTGFSGMLGKIQLPRGDSTSNFSFTGKLQEIPFSLKGDMDVFLAERNGTYLLSLGNYPLASFHEQLAGKTEINTKDGFFELLLNCETQDGQYHNTGSLLFSGVKPLSNKSDSALTLALLTGPEDTFRLDFDFAQADPPGKTVFLEEVLALFQTRVVKAAVSPLLLASGDFTDLIGNELVECNAGQDTLTATGTEILARYIELLKGHPRLGLELSGIVDREKDALAIKEQLEALEQQRVAEENRKRYAEWQQEKAVFEQKILELQKKPKAKGVPPAVLKDFIPVQPKPVKVDDAMLLELAEKRVQLLFQSLTAQQAFEPERLVLVPLKKLPSKQSGGTGGESGVKITLMAIK